MKEAERLLLLVALNMFKILISIMMKSSSTCELIKIGLLIIEKKLLNENISADCELQ